MSQNTIFPITFRFNNPIMYEGVTMSNALFDRYYVQQEGIHSCSRNYAYLPIYQDRPPANYFPPCKIFLRLAPDDTLCLEMYAPPHCDVLDGVALRHGGVLLPTPECDLIRMPLGDTDAFVVRELEEAIRHCVMSSVDGSPTNASRREQEYLYIADCLENLAREMEIVCGSRPEPTHENE
jgi:hypothetical protein